MGKGYLIDTNVIIDYSASKLPQNGNNFIGEIIDTAPNISVINKIELLGFSVVPQPIIEFVESAVIISLEDKVIQSTIKLRKKHKIKLPDAIIAGTALNYELTLITRNISDFNGIEGLDLINPHQIT